MVGKSPANDIIIDRRFIESTAFFNLNATDIRVYLHLLRDAQRQDFEVQEYQRRKVRPQERCREVFVQTSEARERFYMSPERLRRGLKNLEQNGIISVQRDSDGRGKYDVRLTDQFEIRESDKPWQVKWVAFDSHILDSKAIRHMSTSAMRLYLVFLTTRKREPQARRGRRRQREWWTDEERESILTYKAIARRAGVARGGAARTIDRLINLGFIDKVEEPDDPSAASKFKESHRWISYGTGHFRRKPRRKEDSYPRIRPPREGPPPAVPENPTKRDVAILQEQLDRWEVEPESLEDPAPRLPENPKGRERAIYCERYRRWREQYLQRQAEEGEQA